VHVHVCDATMRLGNQISRRSAYSKASTAALAIVSNDRKNDGDQGAGEHIDMDIGSHSANISSSSDASLRRFSSAFVARRELDPVSAWGDGGDVDGGDIGGGGSNGSPRPIIAIGTSTSSPEGRTTLTRVLSLPLSSP